MSWNIETQGCIWKGVKQIKSIFVDNGNSEAKFEELLYYLK